MRRRTLDVRLCFHSSQLFLVDSFFLFSTAPDGSRRLRSSEIPRLKAPKKVEVSFLFVISILSHLSFELISVLLSSLSTTPSSPPTLNSYTAFSRTFDTFRRLEKPNTLSLLLHLSTRGSSLPNKRFTSRMSLTPMVPILPSSPFLLFKFYPTLPMVIKRLSSPNTSLDGSSTIPTSTFLTSKGSLSRLLQERLNIFDYRTTRRRPYLVFESSTRETSSSTNESTLFQRSNVVRQCRFTPVMITS